MARDLIPPASPAGRPNPDGTPNLIELPPEPPRSPAEPAMKAPPGPSEFRNRFGFLLGALAGIFIAAALVTVVAISDRGPAVDEGLEPNWSAWQPKDTSLEGGAAEIAKKVGEEYRLPDGAQLVRVEPGQLPAGYTLTVRPTGAPITEIEGDIVIYRLNGLGPNGSIRGGKPSEMRLKVIHREALELALYTFRYLPDVESVMALLPPTPPKEQPSQQSSAAAAATGQTTEPAPQMALFYRPGDLKPQLQVPLGATLAAKAPSTTAYEGPEVATVDTLTLSNRFVLSEDQPGRLLLDRPTSP